MTKNEEQISEITNKIIDFLNPLDVGDKYRVVSNLYFSFIETCKERGIYFQEFNKDGIA